MERPKILLWHWGRRGGGPRYTLELARALLAGGEVDLHLSLSRQCEIHADFSAMKIQRWDVDTYDSVPSALAAFLRLPKVRRDFWQYVARERFDLVICTMSHLWNVAMLVGQRQRPPYLMVLHDAVPHPGENFLLRHWLLRREVGEAQGVVTLTEHVRRLLCAEYRYPADRTWVIPHGVFPYVGLPEEEREDGAMRLLFFGRILPYKGLDLLLEAHALVRARGVDVALHIAGPGDLGPYMKQLSKLDRVTVDNRWIPEDEIGPIFCSADVSVLPYREASQSGVIATSYAVGVPVVVTPTGGLVEQVRHEGSGLVCEAATAEALADAIVRLAGDPVLRRRCADGAAHEAVETLAWPAIAGSFARCARELLSSRPAIGGRL